MRGDCDCAWDVYGDNFVCGMCIETIYTRDNTHSRQYTLETIDTRDKRHWHIPRSLVCLDTSHAQHIPHRNFFPCLDTHPTQKYIPHRNYVSIHVPHAEHIPHRNSFLCLDTHPSQKRTHTAQKLCLDAHPTHDSCESHPTQNHRITSHTQARFWVWIHTPHTERSHAICALCYATCRYLMLANRNKSHVKFICRVTYFC